MSALSAIDNIITLVQSTQRKEDNINEKKDDIDDKKDEEKEGVIKRQSNLSQWHDSHKAAIYAFRDRISSKGIGDRMGGRRVPQYSTFHHELVFKYRNYAMKDRGLGMLYACTRNTSGPGYAQVVAWDELYSSSALLLFQEDQNGIIYSVYIDIEYIENVYQSTDEYKFGDVVHKKDRKQKITVFASKINWERNIVKGYVDGCCRPLILGVVDGQYFAMRISFSITDWRVKIDPNWMEVSFEIPSAVDILRIYKVDSSVQLRNEKFELWWNQQTQTVPKFKEDGLIQLQKGINVALEKAVDQNPHSSIDISPVLERAHIDTDFL